MSRVATAFLVVLAAVLFIGLWDEVQAQKGRGPKGPKGPPGNKKLPGKGSKTLPALAITDLKADGEYNLASLLPGAGEQPRIGVTQTMAYRLVGYSQPSNSLRFVTYEFAGEKLGQLEVRLPKEVTPFNVAPKVAFGASDICIVSQQAQVCFINMKDKKVVVMGAIDAKAPLKEAKPSKGGRGKGKGPGDKGGDAAPPSGGEVRVHGLPGGAYALSILRNYDDKGKKFTSHDATLYSAAGKSVALKFEHDKYGVPPRGKDAVFGVKGEEAFVLVTKPTKPGDFKGETEVSCLVFDLKTGALKEAQTCPGSFGGEDANTFMMAPTGDYFVAQPWGKYDRFVTKRGTWEQGYKTDYYDACLGFTPDGAIGLFLGNNTPQLAFLRAIQLADSKEVWKTTVTHEQAMGNGEEEPFTSTCNEAKAVAASFGIIEGKSSDSTSFLFKGKAVSFEPLAMAYDAAAKQIAVLALDRMFVLDAKTRAETHSVAFEKPLKSASQAEFIAFSKNGDKVLACVKNTGAWLFDLSNDTLMASMPALSGDHARPLPDLSGVIYSGSAADGGNLMVSHFGQDKATRLYKAEYQEVQAICLWVDEKAESYLVTEKGVGEGNLFLINKKGEKTDIYNVAEIEPRLVGDNAVMAYVNRSSKNVVLVNDVSEGGMALLNCTVIGPAKDDPDPVLASFQVQVKTDELVGSSTYGATAASPYFASQWVGDDRAASLACPAGLLTLDIAKSSFSLSAWSRKPNGVVAVNPKAREFFVAGSAGLSVFKVK